MVKSCLKKLHQLLGLDFREYFGIASRRLLGLRDLFQDSDITGSLYLIGLGVIWPSKCLNPCHRWYLVREHYSEMFDYLEPRLRVWFRDLRLQTAQSLKPCKNRVPHLCLCSNYYFLRKWIAKIDSSEPRAECAQFLFA